MRNSPAPAVTACGRAVRAITQHFPIQTSQTWSATTDGIRAYLATLTPVPNSRRRPATALAAELRIVMRAWNYLFCRPGIFEPNQQKRTEWNSRRGICRHGRRALRRLHTPKNCSAADRVRLRLGTDGWSRLGPPKEARTAPSAKRPENPWSVGDIVEYLQRAATRAAMPADDAEVVANSLER